LSSTSPACLSLDKSERLLQDHRSDPPARPSTLRAKHRNKKAHDIMGLQKFVGGKGESRTVVRNHPH
jgi:hypothetical protein